MTDQQKVREAFEAWAKESGVFECFGLNSQGEPILSMDTKLAWTAWQAALAHASSASAEECSVVAKDAARYRWLRENIRTEGRGYRMPEVGADQVLIRPLHLRFYIDTNGTQNDTLDLAIDQAIAGRRGDGHG